MMYKKNFKYSVQSCEKDKHPVCNYLFFVYIPWYLPKPGVNTQK